MFSRIVKVLGIRTVEIIAIILLLVFLPNIPPHVNISKSYTITPTRPFEGKLALNEKLNNAEITFKGVLHGPEAFAVYNNELYTSLLGGEIVKIDGNNVIPIAKFGKPCKGLYQEQICGRPLGMRFDKNGILYVCDAYYGVFKVDIKSGKKEQLVSMDVEINSKKPKLPNSVTLAGNGDLYWTDSSTQFHLYDGIFDLLSDGSGRLIHYDAKTKKNKVLIDNIKFANGVYLAKDESFVLVAETGNSRLLRYYLKGAKKGTHDVFLDGIPGLLDNLQPDGKGGFFAPLVKSVDNENPELSHSLAPFPLVRRFLARILGLVELSFKLVNQFYPNEWAEKGVHFIGSFHTSLILFPTTKRATVLHISENGHIVDSFHALDGKIGSISDMIVFKNVLYLGSPVNDYLAQVSLDKADLKHLSDVHTQTKPPTKAPPPPTPSPSHTTPPPPPPSKTTPPPTPSPSKTTPPPSPSKAAPTKTTPPPPKTTTPPVKPETPKVKPVAETVKTTPPPVKEVPPTDKPKTQDTPKTKPQTEAPKPTAQTTTDKPKPKTTSDTPKVKPSADPHKANTPKPSTTDTPSTNIPKESIKSGTKDSKIKNEL